MDGPLRLANYPAGLILPQPGKPIDRQIRHPGTGQDSMYDETTPPRRGRTTISRIVRMSPHATGDAARQRDKRAMRQLKESMSDVSINTMKTPATFGGDIRSGAC